MNPGLNNNKAMLSLPWLPKPGIQRFSQPGPNLPSMHSHLNSLFEPNSLLTVPWSGPSQSLFLLNDMPLPPQPHPSLLILPLLLQVLPIPASPESSLNLSPATAPTTWEPFRNTSDVPCSSSSFHTYLYCLPNQTLLVWTQTAKL